MFMLKFFAIVRVTELDSDLYFYLLRVSDRIRAGPAVGCQFEPHRNIGGALVVWPGATRTVMV